LNFSDQPVIKAIFLQLFTSKAYKNLNVIFQQLVNTLCWWIPLTCLWWSCRVSCKKVQKS